MFFISVLKYRRTTLERDHAIHPFPTTFNNSLEEVVVVEADVPEQPPKVITWCKRARIQAIWDDIRPQVQVVEVMAAVVEVNKVGLVLIPVAPSPSE